MHRETTIVNKNLHKLKRLVSTVVTCIILMKPNKGKKISREEMEKLTEQFRVRVADIERRKKEEMLEITQIWKASNLMGLLSQQISASINHTSQFPFLTFNDDKYSEFMTLIMQNLEVRLFKKGETIYNELDECTEVLFVFSGRYNVGYEMNKNRRFRKQFGPSTIIGGF